MEAKGGSRGSPSKVERRLVQALVERGQRGQGKLKTFNSVILKFPQIIKSFEDVKAVFNKVDIHGTGELGLKEIKRCLEELQVNVSEKEMSEIYDESDLEGDQKIEFKEFVVVLALIYFLSAPVPSGPESSKQASSALGIPSLEAAFEIIVAAFIFLDSNGDGYINKEDVVDSVNNMSPSKHADRLGVARFEELDWDNNGQVTFKEFLFAFTEWVGVEEDPDDDGGT